MKVKNVRDLPVEGRRVLVRVDYNVPLGDAGSIGDDTRIQATVPTLRYLLSQRASLILVSHLGRPKGKVVEGLRLDPVAKRLSQILEKTVKKVNDCLGPDAEAAVRSLEPGDVLLLENVRFHPEEEANDPEFARALAALADVYVNDAFSTSHRAHASTVGVTAYLPSAAGLLMVKELDALGRLLEGLERPFTAVLGGSKVADKMGMIKNLPADVVILGGGLANTFLRAQGKDMGGSRVETDKLEMARETMDHLRSRGVRLVLPVDVVTAPEIREKVSCRTVTVGRIPAGWQALDIGMRTLELIRPAILNARTVFWNGPVGVYEVPAFACGSISLARTIVEDSVADGGRFTVIGGGDAMAVSVRAGIADQVSHLSTGGGASLEFLEGRTLPGVEALASEA